jgi:uncharacterized membrane protein
MHTMSSSDKISGPFFVTSSYKICGFFCVPWRIPMILVDFVATVLNSKFVAARGTFF